MSSVAKKEYYEMFSNYLTDNTKFEDDFLKFIKSTSGVIPQDIINLQNQYEETAIMIACWSNNWKLLKLLCSRGEVDINLQNYQGDSALILSCKSWDLKCLRFLLSRNDLNVNLQNKIGDTALMVLCGYRKTKQIELLLKRKPDIFLRNNEGKTVYDIFPYQYRQAQ